MKSGWCRDSHAAFSDIQVKKFIDVRPVFQKDVLSCHPDIRCTALYIYCHIGRLDPEIPDACLSVFKDQLPAVFQQRRALKARIGKHGVYLLAQPSFRQCHIKHPYSPPSVAPAYREIRQILWIYPFFPSFSSAYRTGLRSGRSRGCR